MQLRRTEAACKTGVSLLATSVTNGSGDRAPTGLAWSFLVSRLGPADG